MSLNGKRASPRMSYLEESEFDFWREHILVQLSLLWTPNY